MGLTEQQCSTIARITQGLHNASLLIDDIEDNSTLRRGQPAAHVIYGMPITINCANHVYFLVLQELLSLQNADATSVYVSEMVNLHQGQGMDIHWRDTCQCPTLDEYEEMIRSLSEKIPSHWGIIARADDVMRSEVWERIRRAIEEQLRRSVYQGSHTCHGRR